MTFDYSSPNNNQPESQRSTIKCRSCSFEHPVNQLELEQTKFIQSDQERGEFRCDNCGVVVITIYNQRMSGDIGTDKDQMTHNQFADLLSDLQDNLKNVMTDDEVESFSNEIEELEEKVRT